MQTVFLQEKIADNPVHPSSSAAAYNRTTQVVMVRRPYEERSHSWPFPENAVDAVALDVRDQIQWKGLMKKICSRSCRARLPSPMHRAPLPTLSESACVFVPASIFHPLL